MPDGTIYDLALHAAEFCKFAGFDGAGFALYYFEDDGGGFEEIAVRLVVVEEFEGDGGAGFGVGQSVVMVLEVVTATLGDEVEIVVARRPNATGLLQRTIELVVGVCHPVAAEDGFEAVLVEGFVVGNEWETYETRGNACPDPREDVGITGVVFRQTMYLRTPEIVILRLGFDERIERILHLTIAHDNDTHGADARR